MTEQTPEARPPKRRRLLVAAAVLLVALFVGAFLVWPYFIPTGWIEKAAQTVISSTLERPLSIGSVHVTRLGHIRMDGVVVWRDPAKTSPLLRWESFDLSVKLLPLLRGRIAVERVEVDQPELFVPLSAEGRPALDLPFPAGAGALGLLVGQAAVNDGTVTLLNPDLSPRLTIRHVNLSGHLRSITGPLVFRASFSIPDASERASVGLEGELSLAEAVREITWDAVRGRLRLRLEDFDWQEASTPQELKSALAALPPGLLRRANVDLTVTRTTDEAVEAEGRFSVDQIQVEARGGQPFQLAEASLSGAGRYELASGAVDLKQLHFASPWLDAEFAGRLEAFGKGVVVDGASRGRLLTEGLPRAGREALAGQGVALEGPVAWEAAVKSSPERTSLVGVLELKDAALRVAGLELRRPGEEGRVSFDLERLGEPWTIHRLEVQSREGSLQVVGKVNWQPPERTTVDLRLTGRARAGRLAERWGELHPEDTLALAADGEVRAEATVRGLLGGLTLSGRIDATDALLAVGALALKSPGERATLTSSLELKKQTLLVRQAEVVLPMGSASVRGKLPLDGSRPRYDLRTTVKLDVDELQRRLDQELLWLPAGVTVSGSAEAKAAVNRFQQALSLEADLDATGLEVHWGLEGEKPKGLPARLKLASTFDRGAAIDELALQMGAASVRLAGQVAEGWRSASLRYQGSAPELASLAPLWQPLAARAPRGGVAARGTVEWRPGQTAVSGSVDFQKAAITLPEEPAVRLGLSGSVTHSPTSFSTEGLTITIDDQPITLTAAAERSEGGFKVLSKAEAGRVDLTRLVDHLKGSPPAGGAAWAPAFASAVQGGLKLHGTLRAEELRLASYPLERLALEVNASEGVLRVPLFAFGLNGGEATHDLTVDMTGPEPSLKASIDWKGLGADPNLRPFLAKVFPNLFVTGSLDFSARYAGAGADAARVAETLEGTSTMDVHGGYLVSAPTPQETQEVFPTLTMQNYVFDEAHIETRTAQGRSHNSMRFEAPSVDLIITGWTDNRTREIDYVMVVDLVDNLGLGRARSSIPSVLQSASQVEIAYVRGTLDDQRVEYLAPKVAKIKDTLKSLLGLKTLQSFLVGMSEEEKVHYQRGKVGGLLGAAATPFRYLKRKLNAQ